ncbi:hypothetical protein ACFX2A_026980 [Malus domestica]
MRQIEMKISTGFLVLLLCASFVNGECRIDSSKCKKNIVVPILGPLLSAVALLLVIVLVLKSLNTFKLKSGKGGFGNVHHGYLKDGTPVAVKTLSPSSSQGAREFQTEVELLMKIHHRNLASLIGYCDDTDNVAIIYEYMPNGNLKEYLSVHVSNSTYVYCEIWLTGLHYLHKKCDPRIVHRDVKTANILLSENLDAKIIDFGLSMVFSSDNETHVVASVVGTAGYLDPEYYNYGRLNEKIDVYSIGVVLLELITGQPTIIESDDLVPIVEWVNHEYQSGDLTTILDRRIRGEFDVNSVWKALETAMACTTSTSQHRATMGFVLCQLTQCLEMEVSRHRERTPGSNVETRVTISQYHSSPKVISICSYSTNAGSMTAPYARWLFRL